MPMLGTEQQRADELAIGLMVLSDLEPFHDIGQVGIGLFATEVSLRVLTGMKYIM
jgi:hypothetical protein